MWKKGAALVLSLIIVFASAGCSRKYDVFLDISKKSKQFKDLQVTFDSVDVLKGDKYGCVSVRGTANDAVILVYYDDYEYKNSKNPKIMSLSLFYTPEITSSQAEKDFLNLCKSVLMIDEWGLTLDDLKDLKKNDRLDIETDSGEKLMIWIELDTRNLSVYTQDFWNRLDS